MGDQFPLLEAIGIQFADARLMRRFAAFATEAVFDADFFPAYIRERHIGAGRNDQAAITQGYALSIVPDDPGFVVLPHFADTVSRRWISSASARSQPNNRPVFVKSPESPEPAPVVSAVESFR